ncbi:WD40 repeat-like protein [Suillus decipiens]|nr:WD40 repeat-like protein [Suillus decipiens]
MGCGNWRCSLNTPGSGCGVLYRLQPRWAKISIRNSWSTDNAELLFNIDAHQNSIPSVVWSPNGRKFVSVSSNEAIKFWDSSNGTRISQPYTDHASYINSLTISSAGSFIATASEDKVVRLWSTASHQQIGQALAHTTRFAISLNTKPLASGDDDGNLYLWSIEDTLSAACMTDSSYFARRSKANLGQPLCEGGPCRCGKGH